LNFCEFIIQCIGNSSVSTTALFGIIVRVNVPVGNTPVVGSGVPAVIASPLSVRVISTQGAPVGKRANAP